MKRISIGRSGATLLAMIALTAPPAAAIDQRTVNRTFPLRAGETLRLGNLAGAVEVVAGSGQEVAVTATVYAEGDGAAETSRLLDGMGWVESQDRKGRFEWALSYPVEDFRGFAYPRPGTSRGGGGFLERILTGFNLGGTSTTTYRGRRVTVYDRPGGSVPILYADLRVTLPAEGQLVVRNLVGAVAGEALTGDLVIDTGSGGVSLGSFSGKLNVDTGSGGVDLGMVRGETVVDTGSGGIDVGELIGNASLDTGSGAVRVRKVAAGKLRIDTGSGSITVADGTVGDLWADAGSGRIDVRGVEVETFVGDTGSGGVTLESSLSGARDVKIDTGSGGVKILAGPDASFVLDARQGSGELICRYHDATLHKHGHKVVGAERGDRSTRIRVETGSGDCVIAPQG
jgi:Toastrack DUF4097